MGQVKWLTFEQFHNKKSIGSTNLRVHQLIKYWPEAGIYKYGQNPETLIFQKVYPDHDYLFPFHFEGIKILDVCDPDWFEGNVQVKWATEAVDAITCSSEALVKFYKQLTNKPVIYIPDRFDMELVPEKPKEHKEPAKMAVWFGYSHNAEVLKPALPLIEMLGLKIMVVSNDDPILWRWGSRDLKDKYIFKKYKEETIYQELQKADFALLPKGVRPEDKFKSNNKTVKAILAGLPVATDEESVRKYLDPKERQLFIDNNYAKYKTDYDVKLSIEELKRLIDEVKANRN